MAIKRKKAAPQRASRAKKGSSKNSITLTIILLVFAAAVIHLSATNSSLSAKTSPKAEVEKRDSTLKEVKKQESAETTTIEKRVEQERAASPSLELPYYSDSTYLIKNRDGRYTLMYSTKHKQPIWVAYILTSKEVSTKGAQRKNNFTVDPQVELHGWPTATVSDYSKSGYDRGHLLPSADRDDNEAENSATFLFSNISPQLPALNRGTWSSLEQRVRKWAERHDTIYIVTGAILDDQPRHSIGKNQVTVADHFYKALLVRDGDSYSSIGFIMPNREDIGKDIFGYMTLVDSIEARTGLDLFSLLPDSIEESIESTIDQKVWR